MINVSPINRNIWNIYLYWNIYIEIFNKYANKRPLLSCSFCDRANSSDLFLISFLITSLCWWNDGVVWRCSREACKGRVLVKRCGASGPTVETQRDFGLGATGPRLLARPARLKHWLALARQWKSGSWPVKENCNSFVMWRACDENKKCDEKKKNSIMFFFFYK